MIDESRYRLNTVRAWLLLSKWLRWVATALLYVARAIIGLVDRVLVLYRWASSHTDEALDVTGAAIRCLEERRQV